MPWTGRPGSSEDAGFLQQMTHHHDVGGELAELAAARAGDPRMRALGRLMVAEQQAEAESLRRWWVNLYGLAMPAMAPEQQQAMPGMPTRAELEKLRRLAGTAFDHRFAAVMGRHHAGAIQMADRAWDQASDQRLRLLAAQVRHTWAARSASCNEPPVGRGTGCRPTERRESEDSAPHMAKAGQPRYRTTSCGPHRPGRRAARAASPPDRTNQRSPAAPFPLRP